ncbi:MAG: hypothetical protein DRP06_03645, partial [Candidatus Aenigmatarchaeota archaeon]
CANCCAGICVDNPKTCQQLGGACCDSGPCIRGKISGASDCDECCTSSSDCQVSPFCGDNNCDSGECSSGCTQDCSVTDCCGIEQCNPAIGENCSTCPGDCGECPPENYKDSSKFSSKQTFLISDENWRDVLTLVPLTTWTSKNDNWCQGGYGTADNTCVYSTLIYHKETNAFDIDSAIYFMQQYSSSKVTIIGNTPTELDNLLTAAKPLGAGLTSTQITRIYPTNYLTYWKSYKSIVYVDDNYELALMASVYASLINAPLIIKGYNDNINFDSLEVICVGNPSTSKCDKKYSLEAIQKEYLSKTNTDKFMLVNPNDLSIKVTQTFTPEKSGSSISELYTKTSLAAPILASAKHELILSTTETDYQKINDYLKVNLAELYIGTKKILLNADNFPSLSYIYKDNKYFSVCDITNTSFSCLFNLSMPADIYSQLPEGGNYKIRNDIEFKIKGVNLINKTAVSDELLKKLKINGIPMLSQIGVDIGYDFKRNITDCIVWFYLNGTNYKTENNKIELENLMFDSHAYNITSVLLIHKLKYYFTEKEDNIGLSILSKESDKKEVSIMDNFTITYVIENKNKFSLYIPEESVITGISNVYINGNIFEVISKSNLEGKMNPLETVTLQVNYKYSSIMPKEKLYLTIVAAPNAVLYREYKGKKGKHSNYRALDKTEYADFNADYYPDIPIGRIQGITMSDVSAYVSRDLFYDQTPRTNNMVFLASSFSYMLSQANRWSDKFSQSGYNTKCHTETSECYGFNANEWKNNHLVSYQDHGNGAWAGISYRSIPNLNNSLIFNDACSTCSTYNKYSFCNTAIRKGAIAHLGAVGVAYTGNQIYRVTMNGIYYNNKTIGDSFMEGCKTKYYGDLSYQWMITLFGDPTLQINPDHLLKEPLIH